MNIPISISSVLFLVNNKLIMCKAPTFSTITYFVNNSIYWHPIFFINIWNAKLATQEKSDKNYKHNKVYFYQSKTSFFIIKTVYLKFLCRLSTKNLHITHSTKKSTLLAYLSPKKPLLMFIMHFVPRGFVSLYVSYQKEISSLSNFIFT